MLDNLYPKLNRPNKPGSGCGLPIARVCTIPAPPEGAIQLIGPCVKEGVEPRYETAYACEGKTLKIGCGEGSVIHLIRANYGRFSITICNDHGNTDWSVNCMSTRSLRVLHSRFSYDNKLILREMTLPYKGVLHLSQTICRYHLFMSVIKANSLTASTTSTTTRPSPPWLITSQPTVWRSTAPPVPKSPVLSPQEKKKPTVITPPTFRPHITLPPEVQFGNIGTKKTTTRQPDSSSEREPPQVEKIPDVKEETPKVAEPDSSPKIDKPKQKDDDNSAVTDETLHWAPKDEVADPTVHMPKDNRPQETDAMDEFDKAFSTIATPAIGRRTYCPQINARGLHWNWTLAGTYAVQPCPGGATGLARWKCTLTSHPYIEEERPRRRGSSGLQSGENYHDLGLDQPNERQMQLLRRLGSEALLKGFHLYAMLVEVFEPERPRARWYCAGAYLAPALVVLASASSFPTGYGTPHQCWLTTERWFILSFVVPAGLVLLANWLCLIFVSYLMCRHSTVSIKAKENSKLYKIKVWLNSSVVLAVLLGLTWTFGLLYLNEQSVGVAYTFTILNSLQGLFIFIFYCLQNEIFQKECARLCRRHPWLSCCLTLTGTPPTQSSNHVDTRQGSVKSRRYHQSTADNEDVVDPRDVTNSASTSVSASTTNNLVINNLNVVVNNNNHNNNNVINNASVASLAAAAAAHSYHTHRNRRNSQDNQNFGPPTNFGPTLNATASNFTHNIPEREPPAPMTHLRNPLNAGSGRYPQGYRQNVQQGSYAFL
ncbi:jg9065 [Pararge aegeria aegeria]|uniref:Jg9065 protein n=1 Tax=Pararge aegeria aegeria TaxID=348720 RepID=A0A8S4S210_9NEOP|nr:jg9065 [Pararge aegeria aegeria]